MSIPPFKTPLVLRFGDLDAAGVVYFPRVLHFCHVAMEEYFRGAVGIDYPELLAEHRIGFPTVRAEIDYRRPLRYGEALQIEVRVARVGSTSVEWLYRFLREDLETPSAESRIVTVAVDMTTFEKVPLPAWLRDRLSGFRGSLA